MIFDVSSFKYLAVAVTIWVWLSIAFVKYDEDMRDDVNLYKDEEYCRAHALKSKLMALKNLAETNPVVAGSTDLDTYLRNKGIRRKSK